MGNGDGKERSVGEYGEDEDNYIKRDVKNGEWKISMMVLRKRGRREFSVARRVMQSNFI